jgi:hypothetical protein
MATLALLRGRALEILQPVQQQNLKQEVSALPVAGRAFWVRWIAPSETSFREIPGSTTRPATAQEIADAAYTGDKTKAGWVWVTLPSSEKVGAFAMADSAILHIFTASSPDATDAVQCSEPITIVRISSGSERLDP